MTLYTRSHWQGYGMSTLVGSCMDGRATGRCLHRALGTRRSSSGADGAIATFKSYLRNNCPYVLSTPSVLIDVLVSGLVVRIDSLAFVALLSLLLLIEIFATSDTRNARSRTEGGGLH